MGLLGWLFGGTGKSSAAEKADAMLAQMSEAMGRAVTAQDIHELGRNAFDRGYHAEDNPFPYGTNAFRAWEDGFEDQIYLEHGQEGLDDYYDNPNSRI